MSPAMLYNLPEVTDIAAVDEVTADGNGAWVDTRSFDGVLAFSLALKNIAGTTPTLACKLQHSEDQDVDDAASDVATGAFTGATGTSYTTRTLEVQRNALKRYVRLVDDIGGTSSPKYARHCWMTAHRRRIDS